MCIKVRSLATVLIVATAFAAGSSNEALAQKKTIKSVPIGALRIIDPIWTTAYITRNHAYMVWDTLFSLDAKNEPQPQMVDTWNVSANKLTYTFTLRSGLLWHDNTPVRAADCVASIRRWAAKDGMGRALMSFTDRIETIDDKSFRLVLKQPIGFVIDALAKIDSNVPFMMPERIAKTDPNTQITEVIGSGPFRFIKEEFVPGVKVVYEKFAGYVPRKEPASQAAGGKVVKIDRVESTYMPDRAVALAALGNGEVDLLESPANDLIPTVAKNPNVVVHPNDPLGYQLFIVLNHLHPPFDKKEVRQALQWGVKGAEFLEVVIGDAKRYMECPAVYGCGTANESRAGSEALMGFNVEKARGMLKAAGYIGLPVVLLDPTDNAVLHPAAQVATQTLKRMGFSVDTQALDFSTLTQRRASKNPPAQGGWNVFLTNATMTGIANPLLHQFSTNCERAWYGWPCDRRIVDLSNQWSLEVDAVRKKRIIDQLQKVHMENVTYIPLGQYRSVIAYRKSLRGILGGPALFYWNVEKD